MLAKRFRFHGHRSLQHVYRAGQQARDEYMTAKKLATPNRKVSRAAVVVSKKVHKSAVTRNRMRRRIYEKLRSEISQDKSPRDVVVIVHSDKVAALDSEELERRLHKLLAA